MASKSGDSSLHDWFSKSKSSDGKPGWVQLGGKYAGKPCAKQPGQTTKPKCGSSKMKRALSKDEEERAFRRKNRKDPNPDRSGKAINVKTEETQLEGVGLAVARAIDKTKPPVGRKSVRRDVSNALKMREIMKKAKSKRTYTNKGAARTTPANEETIHEDEYRRMLAKERQAERKSEKEFRTKGRVGEKKSGPKLSTTKKSTVAGKDYADRQMGSIAAHDKVTKKAKITPGNPFPEEYQYEVTEAEKKLPLVKMIKKASDLERDGSSKSMKRHKNIVNTMYGDAVLRATRKEEKDACYHKVKSRYKVWPSAYASGALVKCRKKGAANWGNKTKKEGFTPAQIAALENNGMIEINEAGKKCWKGYKKVGTQKLFGKTYNRCVKENDYGQDLEHENCSSLDEAATRISTQNGQTVTVYVNFRGKALVLQVFFPSLRIPTRKEVQDAVYKVYPQALVQTYYPSVNDPTKPTFMATVEQAEMSPKDIQIQKQQIALNLKKTQQAKKRLSQVAKEKSGSVQVQAQESAAWTRSAGKNKEGGLNEKGRKSYERENPGSDLKAPSKKVGNPRRASFCARMKGMKKKLTSAKTASDPDSRINKSLRAWNC